MNTRTKYSFIIKSVVLSFLINLFIGFVLRTLSKLELKFDAYFIIEDLLSILRGFLIAYIIIGICLLSYFIIVYMMSSFYRRYRINPLEGIYYGVIDIHVVYERLRSVNDINDLEVDFRRQIIHFNANGHYYSVIYQDLFGNYSGKEDSEYWLKLSKKGKSYNQVIYKKKEKFSNPYKINQDFVDTLLEKENHDYEMYTVISGLYKMKYKPTTILAPYEVKSIVK